MLKNMLVAIPMLAVATMAFALENSNITQSIPLRDGSTIVVFKDGKMAMQDKLGRTVRMQQGHVMVTATGERVIMIGDEVARLDTIVQGQNGGRR